MSKNTNARFKKRASVIVLAAGLGLSPILAEAAGLGRIAVMSALGQPLRAEIEINATPEELAAMGVRMASPAAFRQAGVEYTGTLSSLKMAIDKRPSGKAVIRVTSEKPVSDPFVDMLIEVSWASGRLVREYTFLLDPPEAWTRAPATAAPIVQAPPPVETRPAPVEPEPMFVPKYPLAEPKAATAQKPPPRKAAETPALAEGGTETHEVRRGETLHKIAVETLPEGVSLDQMLVSIFRSNREAFDGNMSRMRAGKILSIPAKEDVASIPQAEARREVLAQARDWNAYRARLAAAATAAPTTESTARQEAGGKITARVEAKPPVAESKDQVVVSKTETAAGAPAKPGAKVAEEERIARERATREATERVAALEKNIVDLQKMVDMKSSSLAELQKQAEAKAAKEAKKADVPDAAAKPAEPPKPVEAPPAAEPPKPADATKPAEPPKPVAKPKPKAPPPPEPEPEPSFFDEFGVLILGGVAAVAAALGGLVFVRRRKQRAAGESPSLAMNALSQPSLGANSVFRATGGQSIDTSNVAPASTDFSQTGPGMIDTDEVDPVAEAEVYMAYGRDAQAEEILLEALQKDKTRHSVHLKLLEIYANRKSTKQFETLATDLFGQTGGGGADWEKAATMGQRLDPDNPLYSSGNRAPAAAVAPAAPVFAAQVEAATPSPVFDPEATMIASSPAALQSAVMMPSAPSQPEVAFDNVAASSAATSTGNLDFDLGISVAAAPARAEEMPTAFDFDLGDDKPPMFNADATVVQKPKPAPVTQPVEPVLDFGLPDIDLSAPVAAATNPPVSPAPAVADGGLDFDLGFGDAGATPTIGADSASNDILDIGSADDIALDFDVKLTDSAIIAAPPPVDLSSISLDLEPSAPSERAPKAGPSNADQESTIIMAMDAPTLGGDDDASQEVATKLDLAKAYEDMGDHEGARELLQEVLAEGNSDQKSMALEMLAKLG